MIAEIVSGLNSLKTAKEIVQGLSAMKTEVAVGEVKIELQRLIFEAQQGLFAGQQAQSEAAKRIDELERTIASFENWQREASRYELHRFPMGAFAYVLKASEANGEPIHRICPDCYQQGHKGFLQMVSAHSGGEMVQCSRCKCTITLSEFRPSIPSSDGGSGYF
ncbi:MAG TPA: hypothetical protein VEX35_04785 [Allosphingosinicella sp.]|nr:hypothetical protein [Allosphingosinicella sp.]